MAELFTYEPYKYVILRRVFKVFAYVVYLVAKDFK